MRVFKTHQYTPAVAAVLQNGFDKIFYCYRDVRDVISSLSAKNNVEYDIQTIRRLTTSLLNTDKKWHTAPGGICIVSYEILRYHLSEAVYNMANELKIQIDKIQANEIAKKYSLKAQRGRIESFDEKHLEYAAGNKFDKVSLLHVNHLNGGEIGRYRLNLSPAQIVAIKDVACSWLQKRGYWQ